MKISGGFKVKTPLLFLLIVKAFPPKDTIVHVHNAASICPAPLISQESQGMSDVDCRGHSGSSDPPEDVSQAND
jgi:hypothetical protein